jgi:hypothetical protein
MSFGKNMGVYARDNRIVNLRENGEKLQVIADRFWISRQRVHQVIRGRKPSSQDTVARGELKHAENELRAACMRSRGRRWTPSLTERLQIVRGLLQLQKRGVCRVWVDGDVIQLGLCEVTAETPRRKPVSWDMAAGVVDNPEKNLSKLLKVLEAA